MPKTMLLAAAASLSYTLAGVFMKYSQGLRRGWPSILLFALSWLHPRFKLSR